MIIKNAMIFQKLADLMNNIDNIIELRNKIKSSLLFQLSGGKKGEPIVITISRANTEPFEIEIIRDYIKIRSVKSEVLNNIGYLRITSFNEQTESGLLDAIKKIEKEVFNEAKSHFKPEFLNRIDDVVFFNSLQKEHIDKIGKIII